MRVGRHSVEISNQDKLLFPDDGDTIFARGIAPTGTLNYGGPVVTASGLVFIGVGIYMTLAYTLEVI